MLKTCIHGNEIHCTDGVNWCYEDGAPVTRGEKGTIKDRKCPKCGKMPEYIAFDSSVIDSCSVENIGVSI